MPSVAIVISGAYRALLQCNGTVVEHVMRANPDVTFDVYLHLTAEHGVEHSAAARDALESFPCVMGSKVERNHNVTAAVRAELPGVADLPRGQGTARGKALNIVKM